MYNHASFCFSSNVHAIDFEIIYRLSFSILSPFFFVFFFLLFFWVSLQYNNIGDEGVDALSKMLLKNETLKVLKYETCVPFLKNIKKCFFFGFFDWKEM